MVSVQSPRALRTFPSLIAVFLLGLPVYAKYSGGTGEPNDPYEIATAADLIALGETPADYDKHFILTADIDLDPNLPGRKVFDKAVMAPDTDPVPDAWGRQLYDGSPFTGVFDGKGHTISHLTIRGVGYLGLFGQLGQWNAAGEIRDLGVVDASITGSGEYVGEMVGYIWHGTVTQCHSTGVVRGTLRVGGLAGYNYPGTVIRCWSTSTVSGNMYIGGLVGQNRAGVVTQCYSAGRVSADGDYAGGLIGINNGYDGAVTMCYSTSAVISV